MKAVRPADYRISVLPGMLEVSARLTTVEQIDGLVNVLRSNSVTLANKTKNDRKHLGMEVSDADLRVLRRILGRAV